MNFAALILLLNRIDTIDFFRAALQQNWIYFIIYEFWHLLNLIKSTLN